MKRDNHGFDDALADIVYTFSEYKDKIPPDSEEVLTLVSRWQEYLTKNHYECTDEMLETLGKMYAGDDFSPVIDVFGKGTAKYMSDAIAEYCKIKTSK